MSAREAILERLRAQARPAELPAAWRSRREFPDLVERFGQSLAAAGGEVHRADDPKAALGALDALLSELEARRIVVNAEPPLDGVDFPARWPERDWHVVGRSEGDLRAFCAGADLGLSGACGALAETGTVVIASGPGHGRLATLLPPVHLALVSSAQLSADLFAWAADKPADLPAALTFISGPSKTADIGQTLSVGVHGPGRFIVVVYDG